MPINGHPKQIDIHLVLSLIKNRTTMKYLFIIASLLFIISCGDDDGPMLNEDLIGRWVVQEIDGVNWTTSCDSLV